MSSHLQIKKEASDSLDCYLKYCQNGGEEQFGVFNQTNEKKLGDSLLNQTKLANVTVWKNHKNQVCQKILLAKKCFCNHMYKEHDYFNTNSKSVKCKIKTCECLGFMYLPVHGSSDLKCQCKHSFTEHKLNSLKCLKCQLCLGFEMKNACACGSSFRQHQTEVHVKQHQGIAVHSLQFSDLLFEADKMESSLEFQQTHKIIGGKNHKLKRTEIDQDNTELINGLHSGFAFELLHKSHRFT